MNHEQKIDNRRPQRPQISNNYADWDEDEDPEWEDRSKRRKNRDLKKRNKFRNWEE